MQTDDQGPRDAAPAIDLVSVREAANASPFSASQLRRRQRLAEAAAAAASAAFPPAALRNYFVKALGKRAIVHSAVDNQHRDPALIVAALADAIGAQIAQLATCFKQSSDQSALNFLQMVAAATRTAIEAQQKAIADLAEGELIAQDAEAKPS